MRKLSMNEFRNEKASDIHQKKGVVMRNGVYEAPKVLTFGSEALKAVLGPSLSCTGFGGSVSC